MEQLEGRELFSVTGFSLVNQTTLAGAPATVTNQPTIFKDQLQQSWTQLLDGQLKISGQTLSQVIAAGIEQGEQTQGLSAYHISTSFDATPNFTGTLVQTSSGPVLELTFDAVGNQTTFTSTTHSILGSYADPTFHVSYDLDLSINLALPTNLVTGKVTASATASVANVSKPTTNNIFVTVADVFGANIPGKIQAGINGQSQDISSIVPTGLLNTALQLETAQGYTHLISSTGSNGNLLLTALKPSLIVNGLANDQVTIKTGSNNQLVVSTGAKSETFPAGYLTDIIVNTDAGGTNTVSIPSLPSGVTVQVMDSGTATDTVLVGSGSLASVAGTVSVSNSSGKTSVVVNDKNDTAGSKLTVTNNAIQLNGHTEVSYATTGTGQTALTVDAGPKDTTAINSSSAPLTIIGTTGSVTVGNGSLSTIGGPVSDFTTGPVIIDDFNDKTGRKVDLSSTSLVLLTLHSRIVDTTSIVAFEGLATITLGSVKGVTIEDGSGNNTFNAESSPSQNFFYVAGHFGDSLIGPAASQVELSLLSRIHLPIIKI
jgi:hypothetical protein